MTTNALAIPHIHALLRSELTKGALGFLLLFACGQISIPIKPVPIVLTTVAVMLIGLLYNRRTACATVLAFIGAGACGLPVWQGFASGMAQLRGPSGGYIIGFLLAVWVMTSLRKRLRDSFFGMMINCAIGTVAIFIPGLLWLSTLIGFDGAIKFGLLPFIIPGILKAGLLCAALKILRPKGALHRA